MHRKRKIDCEHKGSQGKFDRIKALNHSTPSSHAGGPSTITNVRVPHLCTQETTFSTMAPRSLRVLQGKGITPIRYTHLPAHMQIKFPSPFPHTKQLPASPHIMQTPTTTSTHSFMNGACCQGFLQPSQKIQRCQVSHHVKKYFL
jgi:hypothetical protein